MNKEEINVYTNLFEYPTKTIVRLEKENQQLKEQVIIMEKYLELIHDLAFDYDGCNTIESLKKLIDELDRYARLGRVCNTTEMVYVNENENKKYNILHQELEKGVNNG